jgi:2-polyprenyl-3-methyl-5-hydroxy-6-metoxy-1,4-benzoquinol methylase
MDAVACRVCNGPLELRHPGAGGMPGPVDFAPSNHRPGEHGDLYRCADCGSIQQPSLPSSEDLHALYREMHDDAYLHEEAGRRATARRLLALIAAHVPAGKLLDVGCGHGLLLDEARRLGFDVSGLELSQAAAEYATGVLGLDVAQESVETHAESGHRYDVIVLADVIEHLDDPVAAIAGCASMLAEGGALCVVTPDPASTTAKIAGARWWGLVPAHTCLLPRRTLRELLAAEGLVVSQDVPLVRSFELRYWLAGLSERGGAAGRALRAFARTPLGRRRVSLSLGDERVVLAHRTPVTRPAEPLVRDRGGAGARVAVVLPAYNAADTIAAVANEMPVGAVDRVLLVDDASRDETSAVALREGFDVLRHPANRGYGGNQKTCYVRALLDGADIVVMVHADNQYDPALVERMVKPIESGIAEVVIGSRLLEDETLVGGMPRWKWVGNRALTAVENLVFRRGFSEYHTGYRAFSADFLGRVAFLRNSDDFVFDQEIFAQIVASGSHVVELPIPTRYFLEASSVSFPASVRYGFKTLWVLARFRLDRRGRRWALLRPPAARLGAQRPHAAARE